MLKITESTKFTANSEETKDEAGGNSIVGDSIISSGEAINQISSIKRKNQAKTTKSKILVKSKNRDFPPNSRNIGVGSGFLTPKARLAFSQLRQAFIEALILHHFDLKCYI